jgi:hypothetical protein
MRDLLLQLNVLQEPEGPSNAWPGIQESVDFSDVTCPSVDGDTPYWKITLGFVVMGFDASASDSLPAPDGWQFYDQGEATDLIPLWAAQSLEWHAATKIECSNNPDNAYLVSDSYYDVLDDFNICCGTPTIQTQVLALKASHGPLDPGSCPSCGKEAVFKSLAIKGTNDTRTLASMFRYILRSSDNLIEEIFELDASIPLTAVNSRTMRWPDDFIGLTSLGDITLIANDQEPIPGSTRRVLDFDCGTIEVQSLYWDVDDDLNITTATNTWALPITNCGPNCELPYPDGLALPDATDGVPYNQIFVLEGDGPFQLNVITKPDWLTMTLNPLNGQVTMTGTPDDFGDFDVEFQAENCGEDIVPETPSSGVLTLHVAEVLAFSAGTPAANRTWYKAAFGAGLFVAIKQQGTDAQVMTSPDGVTWTTRAVPEDLNWNDICWSEDLGLFVAVAQGGSATEVMTSPDGITWTARNQSEAGQWRSVVWAPALNLFVAVGTLGSNRVMTSPDGITWTSRTAAALNNWYGVTWSPELGLLVAVGITGTGNRIMTSPDGINWTTRTSPADIQWRKVIWSPDLGLFVAIADSGVTFGQRVMTSPDGITWTIGTTVGNAIWASLAWGNGIFVAVANSGGTGPRIAYSDDGINWTAVTGPGADSWLGVAFGDDKFVAVGVNAAAVAPWFAE